MSAIRLMVVFAALAVATHGARADDSACRKNHYILSVEPCPVVPAPEISIGRPGAIAVDAKGNVFFSGMHAVFKLSVDGNVVRIAGNGTPGFSGDGGPAIRALLDIPFDTYVEYLRDPMDWTPLIGGLTVDAEGNLFIADSYNDRVRRIDAHGTIRTVADGRTGEAPLRGRMRMPQGVAVDSSGTLYVSGWGPLWRVPSTGKAELFADYNCGPPWRGPGLCAPELLAAADDGSVYVPDAYCRIRRVWAGGSVTIAGNEGASKGMLWTCGYAGESVPALGATLSYYPMGVALDRAGNLYIADTDNNCIRKVDANGIIATFAGRCDPSRGGISNGGFAGDGGAALDALLDRPYGVAVDGDGNVYIADTFNGRIRKVATDGTIDTVAGNGEELDVDP